MTNPTKLNSMPRAEAAARGALTKLGPRKRLLIRALEIFLLPLVRLAAWLGPTELPGAGGPARKILVVEYWQLGDAILLLPFLQNLRKHYPQSEIFWLGNPRVLPLLKGQGLVDRVIPVRVPWAQHFSRWRKYNPFSRLWIEFARVLLQLRREQFDLALSGRMDIRDNFLLWLSGARRRVGFGVGGGSFLLTDVAAPDLAHPHRSYSWMRLLEHIGCPLLETRARLRLSSDQKEAAAQFTFAHAISEEEIVIGFHAGARIATRGWGASNFISVLDELRRDFPVRILWFEEPATANAGPDPGNSAIRVALPLDGFLAVLSSCDLLICNDSGPMHMAEALGVPVVAVFGPTQPAWFGPTDPASKAVFRPEFWCRPCFDYCQFDEPYCLRSISVESVSEAASLATQSIARRKAIRARETEVHTGKQQEIAFRSSQKIPILP